VSELLPVASGIVLGAILACLCPGLRLRIGAVLAIFLGTIATLASGEFGVSWGYLLVDVALVTGSALVSMMLAHKTRLDAFTVQDVPCRTDVNEKQETPK
jgi:hypothetical protein